MTIDQHPPQEPAHEQAHEAVRAEPAVPPGPAPEQAQEIVPVEPAVPTGPARWPVAVALLNLTGLSLGYWYLARRRRAVLCLAVTVALVVAAFATDAASRPWLWRAIFVVWLAWMAFDGWRLARRHPGASAAPRRQPGLVAAAVVLAVVAGYALYGVAGDRVYASGETAQAAGDCGTATSLYDWVTGPFELTLSRDVATAEQNREHCALFLAVAAQHDRGQLDEAIVGYQRFLDATPRNPLDGHAHERLQRAYLALGQSANADGAFGKAIGAYTNLLDRYPDSWSTGQARIDLARVYVDEAAQYRSHADPAGGDTAVDDIGKALKNYLLLQRDFADIVPAADLTKAITDTFNEGFRPVASGRFCEALPTLDHLAGRPVDESAGMVAITHEHRAKSYFECGAVHYRAGSYAAAIEQFDTVSAEYSNHVFANAARSAHIAATIAMESPPSVPVLPEPLGNDTPGTIRVAFFNDSSWPTEVLVSGPTAHRFVLPGCPSCPEAYETEAEGCTSSAGKPTHVLRLRPGDYHLMNRDVDDQANVSEVVIVQVRAGSQSWCLSRGPNFV